MDDDYMAMFNAGVDANIMLLKQKKIIVDQDAEIERLREALEHVSCMCLGQCVHGVKDRERCIRYTARSALQQTQSSHAQMSDDKGQR